MTCNHRCLRMLLPSLALLWIWTLGGAKWVLRDGANRFAKNLQETITDPTKREKGGKIIFKSDFLLGYVRSQEGKLWRDVRWYNPHVSYFFM